MARELMKYEPPTGARHRELTGLPLASFGRRAAALILDFLIAGVSFLIVLFGVSYVLKELGWLTDVGDVNLEFGFFKNWYDIIWLIVYFSLGLYWGKGRTPAKRIFKLRVVSLAHERLGFWHCVERALGYGASTLELGMGFVQYFFSPNRQTTHDRIADTIVVSERPVDQAWMSESAPQEIESG